jgi:hypothetical protein
MKAIFLILPHIISVVRHLLFHALHIATPQEHGAEWSRTGWLQIVGLLLCVGFLATVFVAIRFVAAGRRS